MKVRRKKSKSLKILKSVVLVLFLSLLFVPDNINRSVIAGIALAGILGSLLFLIVPHLPRIPSPALKRKSAYSSGNPDGITDAEFDSIDTSDRYRLMDMSARNGNRDGAALRFVAEHLAKRPEKQKLLIIISDGQPADTGYYGTEAEADLRGIKKEYSKKGIKLFAAAIGDDKENIKRIYQDGFLDITKLEDLPKNMTLLVKQYLK